MNLNYFILNFHSRSFLSGDEDSEGIRATEFHKKSIYANCIMNEYR